MLAQTGNTALAAEKNAVTVQDKSDKSAASATTDSPLPGKQTLMYDQRTGSIDIATYAGDGGIAGPDINITHVGNAYAGKGDGKNNPGMEDVANTGPLPKGDYSISNPFKHPKTGEYTLRLTPDKANEMYGRDGFLIHGDSTKHPGQASEGCIVTPKPNREAIHDSGLRTIHVYESTGD
jgi:hypothetical protein